MRRSLAGCAALLLAVRTVLARQPLASAAPAGKRSAANVPASPKSDQGVPLEALLFQSPLTVTLAAIDWARKSGVAEGWSRKAGLISEGAHADVFGGASRICIFAISIFMTFLLIMTLWSLATDQRDSFATEAEPLFERGARSKSWEPPDVPAVAPGAVPPICPKLMLPHGAAQFRIPMDSIRKLRSGIFPVEVYGTSKDPLLHAWLPRFGTMVDDPDDCGANAGCAPVVRSSLRGKGLWLQLTTTSTSRHPHACVGPLFLRGVASEQAETVRILGPAGRRYGTFEPSEDSWRVVCDGCVVLTVTASLPFPHLNALDSQGFPVASAGQQRWSIMGTDALIVQVNQGADALLALLCMLAVVLVSVDLAVPPMKFPSLGGRSFR